MLATHTHTHTHTHALFATSRRATSVKPSVEDARSAVARRVCLSPTLSLSSLRYARQVLKPPPLSSARQTIASTHLQQYTTLPISHANLTDKYIHTYHLYHTRTDKYIHTYHLYHTRTAKYIHTYHLYHTRTAAKADNMSVLPPIIDTSMAALEPPRSPPEPTDIPHPQTPTGKDVPPAPPSSPHD